MLNRKQLLVRLRGTETPTPLDSPELHANLAKLGVTLLSFPPPTGDEKLRLEGWRNGIEKYGQELWTIYHWTVWAQDGRTNGIYRLRQWLESFGVPDNTAGAHWPMDIPGAEGDLDRSEP